eukprot:1020198-Karenia_brevis.AAC.1
MPVSKIKPPTLQKITVFRKLSPPKGPKVRCLSAKSRLPEVFGTRRHFNYFHADQVSTVTLATSPTSAGGQDV